MFREFRHKSSWIYYRKNKKLCIRCAIPVYYGAFDDIDEKVFNKNRVLFVNATNIANVGMRVKHLASNPAELIDFYTQPVFEPTAKDTVAQMLANVDAWFTKLREQVATNSSSDTR